MGRPIYQGRNSCYAIKEGVYVPDIREEGIDTVTEAVAIAYLILRDYRMGYTYDHNKCRKIPMDLKLFNKRMFYLKPLAIRHKASPSALRRIQVIIYYVTKYKRMPKSLLSRARKALRRVHRRT